MSNYDFSLEIDQGNKLLSFQLLRLHSFLICQQKMQVNDCSLRVLGSFARNLLTQTKKQALLFEIYIETQRLVKFLALNFPQSVLGLVEELKVQDVLFANQMLGDNLTKMFCNILSSLPVFNRELMDFVMNLLQCKHFDKS